MANYNSFSPMLIRNTPCTPAMFDKLRGMVAQPKIDGVRLCFSRPVAGTEQVSMNRLRIWTRSGQRLSPRMYNILDEILPKDTSGSIIDGELVYDNDCASTTGILHSKHIDIDTAKLHYYAFDLYNPLDTSMPCMERWNSLMSLSLSSWTGHGHVTVLPSWHHTSHTDSLQASQNFSELEGLPYEGYVLKPANSLYSCGRRLDGSFKFKVCEELTGLILNVYPQVGQDHVAKDLAGIIEVQVGEGKDASIVNVTASCNNILRAKIMEHAWHLAGFPIKFRVFSCPSGNTDTAALRMPRYVSGLEFLLR